MSDALKRKRIKGTITVPGDKSISHRAVMLSGISRGKSLIRGFLKSDDCMSTISCLGRLGIEIAEEDDCIAVNGKGLHGLRKPEAELNAGNSGTTMRLLSGILSGQEFQSTITGDESLRKRPMSRIAVPLRQMGATIESSGVGEYAPLSIRGGRLKGIEYRPLIASAQVKSAILLAGLYIESITRVIETIPSRNHTEIMLKHYGAEINGTENTIEISKSELTGREIEVPGDISSAAFFIAAFAEGTTVISGAGELKVKESNRIVAMVSQLGRLGVSIRELEDGMEIEGPSVIKGGEAESFGDHRIAMAMAICGLFAEKDITIKGKEAVSISFPGFFDILSDVVVKKGCV